MNYGDLGKRILAYIIDNLILSLIGFILGYTLGIVGVIIAPIVLLFYYIMFEGSSWHATIGKRVMGLYIAYEDGRGITYATSILRLIGKLLSYVILGIGYLMGFFNDEKQCLHDMIAKTYVLDGESNGSYKSPKVVSSGQSNGRKLVGVSGPLAGAIYYVSDNGLLIGRDEVACQVVIPQNQVKVSRTHCFVTYNNISGMFVLNDRNSTHGTYLSNGSKIPYEQPVALRSGDRFYLATPENMFEVR